MELEGGRVQVDDELQNYFANLDDVLVFGRVEGGERIEGGGEFIVLRQGGVDEVVGSKAFVDIDVEDVGVGFQGG